jgi:glycosyltransferase involved in cell wall biosynthesis
MKKICMVAYTNYLSDARPRREAETLVRRGDQVDFIALGERDRPPIETVEGVTVYRVRQLRYRGGGFLSYGFSYFRFLCAATIKLLRLFSKGRYDVVYVHSMPDLLVLVGVIPKLLGARIVLNIHDMMPEMYLSKFQISEKHPLIRLLAFEEQFSIRLADKVICVHHPHRDVLCRRGAPKAKITVLPNVPDPRIFKSDAPARASEDAFRIVYHGTIATRLGLDLAVRAFAMAAGSCPGARLEIYGDGDAADALETQIKASGMEDRIYFSKKTFRVESIAELIQGASMGLIPNRRDAATEYMLPVKLLEYVHLGIPAIAPRLLAIQYYFGEDQVAYYEPGDVEELAGCITRLYADPAKRAHMALKSAEFANKFHWDNFKEDLYKVIDGESSAADGTAGSTAA